MVFIVVAYTVYHSWAAYLCIKSQLSVGVAFAPGGWGGCFAETGIVRLIVATSSSDCIRIGTESCTSARVLLVVRQAFIIPHVLFSVKCHLIPFRKTATLCPIVTLQTIEDAAYQIHHTLLRNN